MDVCEIAKKLNQTEANISAQIKILEKAHLVTPKFEVGRHGVKKICELNADRIIINI
jgi:predicted transcriptional regulator